MKQSEEPSKGREERPGSIRDLPGGYIVICNPSGESKLRSTPYRNVFPEEFIPEADINIYANVITGSFEEFERELRKIPAPINIDSALWEVSQIKKAELLCETYKKNKNA